ncbi:unnamed protein product [Cyprideis torosa]|uniref:Uncharacterized protein n=1 Tax=Cyprideis torosa TaxID=163714 RepID=A0A7R8WBA4_9CRUS|nr:unnamed protein product [Cyprideis torosa]CAG0892067.1 unnamed protein product [Cyprideis torosa]
METAGERATSATLLSRPSTLITFLFCTFFTSAIAEVKDADIDYLKSKLDDINNGVQQLVNENMLKLTEKISDIETLVRNTDSNVMRLQEKAHIWEAFQQHVTAWNEQIKSVEQKIDLLKRIYLKSGKTPRSISAMLPPLPEESPTELQDCVSGMNNLQESIVASRKQVEEVQTTLEELQVTSCDKYSLEMALQRIDKKISEYVLSESPSDHAPNKRLDVRVVESTAGTIVDNIVSEMRTQFAKAVEALKDAMRREVDLVNPQASLKAFKDSIRAVEICCQAQTRFVKNAQSTTNHKLDHLDNIIRTHEFNEERRLAMTHDHVARQMHEIFDRVDKILVKLDHEFMAERSTTTSLNPQETTATATPKTGTAAKTCHQQRYEGVTTNGILCEVPLDVCSTTDWRSQRKSYCDQKTDEGGWTVIHRRGYFGLPVINFTKSWSEYRQGFGDLLKEFWIGNDLLHILTNSDDYVLRIELADFEGNFAFAEYHTFNVGPEVSQYLLQVGDYYGNASDAFSSHNGSQFSTFDRRNDLSHPCCPCVDSFGGGWWFNSCFEANLNGEYLLNPTDNDHYRGIIWELWKGDYSLKAAEMKIRPRWFSQHVIKKTWETPPPDP